MIPVVPRVLALTAGLLLAGCVPVSLPERPEPDLAPRWSASLPESAAASDDDMAFWHATGDARLAGLIERALRDSRELREASARIAEARALARIADAASAPSLGVGVGANRERLSEHGRFPIRGLDNPATIHQPGFDAAWEPDIFGRIAARGREAGERARAAEHDQAALRVALAAEVGRVYVELRAGQAQAGALARQADAGREALGLVRAQARAGLVAAIEEERARDLLAQIEAREPRARAAVERAKRQLGLLVGGRPDSLLDELAAPAPLPTAPPVPARVPAELLERRADLKALEAQLASARAGVGAAEAARLPDISLAGTLGWLALGGADLFKGASLAWNLGARARLPLLDGGAREAGADVARARHAQLAARWEQAAQTAVGEVEAAAIDLDEARTAAAALERALAAQHEVLKLAKTRFERGLADFSLPLDATRQWLATETETIAARARVVTETFRLYKALGGGWREGA